MITSTNTKSAIMYFWTSLNAENKSYTNFLPTKNNFKKHSIVKGKIKRFAPAQVLELHFSLSVQQLVLNINIVKTRFG